MEWVIGWFCLAVVTAIAAGSRGRSAFGWFLLALPFSLFALIAVLVMPNLHVERERKRAAQERQRAAADSKTCPRCAETVRSAAKICRYCGYEFSATEIAYEDSLQPKSGVTTSSAIATKSRYKGIDYRVHKDGNVSALLGNRPHTWESVSDFKVYADRTLESGRQAK